MLRTASSAGPAGARWPGPATISSPSTQTLNVSGSTLISGQASLRGHVGLRDRARALDGAHARLEPELEQRLERHVRDEGQRPARRQPAAAGEHRPHQDRLRRRDRGVGVSHRRVGDRAALEHQPRPDRERRRVPQHEVGELADLDRADLVRDPVRDRRVDRVLGHVALESLVAVAAALGRHHVRGLPGAHDRLAHAPHGLRVRPDHRDRAHVVQHVLGGDRRAADAALGERQVLRDPRVQVVADDQHVEVLVDGVDRVRPRRVGRGRQHVRLRRRP